MRVEILRNLMISGEPAAAGSFVELEDAAAMLLIGMGKAAYAPAAPAPAPEPIKEPEPVEAPACPPTKPVSRRGRTSSSTSKD
jgi:hypothetical protein